jgi:mannosyl-3-phosphoglycerate phosphatase
LLKKYNYIIFSDLDGTLLDHNTYQFSEANQALKLLKQKKIPVVLSSSKTKIEMSGLQKLMEIEQYPFIVENGSAVYTTNNYFTDQDNKETIGNYDCYKLGITYKEIVNIIEKISAKYDLTITGFHNTDKGEIMEKTLLDERSVEMAMNREFSVPLFYDDKTKEILLKEIEKYELKLLFGGRFMHLLGKTDKGKALHFVKNAYGLKYKLDSLKTIAIGDTLNDAAMLQAADIKILVKRHNNKHDERVQIENLLYSPYIGPKGWNHSIIEIIKSGE